MNQLDRTFAKDLRAANGDGSREAKFILLKKIDAIAKAMSSCGDAEKCLTEMCILHGRAAVGICLAATIFMRKDRLELWGTWPLTWAIKVLDLWTTKPRTETGIDRAYIHDNGHPEKMLNIAIPFINNTTELGWN